MFIDEDELNKKLQKNLSWVLVLTGCIGNMVGFLSNAMMFGMSLPTIVCGVCEVIVILCGIAGIGLKKQKVATVVMILVTTLIEFPFLFYVYGASMGVYLILGIVALAVYFPKPYKIPILIGVILLDVTVIMLSSFYPVSLDKMNRESQFGTVLCSYIIVAVVLSNIRQIQRLMIFSIMLIPSFIRQRIVERIR